MIFGPLDSHNPALLADGKFLITQSFSDIRERVQGAV